MKLGAARAFPANPPGRMPLPRRSPVSVQFSSRGFSRGMNEIPPLVRFPFKVNRLPTPPKALNPPSCSRESGYPTVSIDGEKRSNLFLAGRDEFFGELKSLRGSGRDLDDIPKLEESSSESLILGRVNETEEDQNFLSRREAES